jgi:hypothetical protein
MNPPPLATPAPPSTARRAAVLTRTLPVMGVPVRFETDAARVLEAVDETFGAWAGAEPEGWSGPPLTVRIRMAPGSEGADGRVPLRERWAGGRLRVRTPASRGVADIARRTAVARVTRALVRDREQFRHGVLERLTLWMVTAMDRQPLHAAALERDGTALLLAGRSGVGKSTLVYAALRAGLRVLTEDCVFLQSLPEARVWGMPGSVHLMPEAVRWFPELAGRAPVVRPNGKRKIAVDLREAGAAAPAAPVRRAGICLLARGPRPSLEVLSPHAVAAELTAELEPGFDRFAATLAAPLRRMAERGAWRLTLPPNPHDAVPLLHGLLDSL